MVCRLCVGWVVARTTNISWGQWCGSVGGNNQGEMVEVYFWTKNAIHTDTPPPPEKKYRATFKQWGNNPDVKTCTNTGTRVWVPRNPCECWLGLTFSTERAQSKLVGKSSNIYKLWFRLKPYVNEYCGIVTKDDCWPWAFMYTCTHIEIKKEKGIVS